MPQIGFKRKKANNGGAVVKQRLLQFQTDPEGCKENKGTFDDKTGLCEVLQEINPEKPHEVKNKEFDEVKRPEKISGAVSADGF